MDPPKSHLTWTKLHEAHIDDKARARLSDMVAAYGNEPNTQTTQNVTRNVELGLYLVLWGKQNTRQTNIWSRISIVCR